MAIQLTFGGLQLTSTGVYTLQQPGPRGTCCIQNSLYCPSGGSWHMIAGKYDTRGADVRLTQTGGVNANTFALKLYWRYE